MLKNSLEFYVGSYDLHACLLDLHTIIRDVQTTTVVVHEVFIKQKNFRRLLREENNRIMAAWNFR